MYFFLKIYDDLIFEVSKEVKPENANKEAMDFDSKTRYHFFFGFGGAWSMANRWIINGCKETPEELAQYVIAFLVESYELEPDCQFYAEHKKYPYPINYI